MASRRQRRRIGDKKKKKRKTRAATIKKKIVKTKESAPAPQAVQPKSSAARTGSRETVGEAAVPVVKEKNHDERRRRDKRTCAVCGEGKTHDNEPFCPYNYIHGLFGLRTCMERCRPGSHPLLRASDSGSHHQLRRLVRVTNVPLCAIPGNHELKWLFRRFGPLVGCNLERLTLDDCVGFGWVAFESRQHAEEAINQLNGHLLGDRRLRVDWFYPRT